MQVNGGIQYVPQIAVQYVYLDFDGELTGYNGEILTVENVEVIDSKLSAERIAAIVAELNTKYASQNVIFVTGRPTVAEYSTIYIGKTSAFEQYGSFAGLAETIDSGNKNKSDKAFVMLDASSSNESIISTISHETNHLLGTLNHGGEGLAAYAYYSISSGVTFTGIVLEHDYIYIESGGRANSTTVDGGYMYISSGGIANSTTINGNGYGDGRMYIYSGGTANYTTVTSEGRMVIYSGGTANDTIVNYLGDMTISSGGTANSTTFSGHRMYISRGGTANSTTVDGGYMYIYSGGTANSTTVDGGYMYISSGGTATQIVENGGYVGVADGANVTFVSNTIDGLTISSYMTVHSNTVANSTTVNSDGYMGIFSGGTANDTTINGGHNGGVYIYSGGTANSTTVSRGDMYIRGGTANYTTVNSYGRMFISSGGVHRGTLQIANGAAIYTLGATIDFTVSGRKTTDTYLINDLSRISGTPTYTITVDTRQASGTYKLAQGAGNFSGTVTIGNGTTDFGTITVNGNDFKHNGVTYSLDKAGGNLTLTIDSPYTASTLNTDIKNRGYSQILAWDRNRGAIGMADNQGTTPVPWRGVWDWDDKDAALWRVAGAGHFKGTNVGYDGILLYNGVGNRFAAWTDINTGSYGYVNLCKVEGSFNTRSLADLDGNEYDDILIYDETGSFGVVLDGTTYKDIWHVDKGKFNTWDIIGAGKFDNGTDKLVTENNYNHQIYLWTNNDPTFNTWNWSTKSIGTLAKGDEVVAIGDFQGDGIDDIVVQLADGNMWCWDNGNSQTKRWIGNPGDNFTVEAVGDYNGDGKEDILLREQASGWGGLGYWGAGYAGNWTDMKTRIETDTRISGSKFDIIA